MANVTLRREGAVTEVVLTRPKVNAQNRALLEELGEALAAADADPAVRGVLLLGEGRCFSAGLDLGEVGSLDREGLLGFLSAFDLAYGGAFGFTKPMAAAISGHAIAGGLVLPLAADFVAFQRGDYKVGATELAVGVPFPLIAHEIMGEALPPRAWRRIVWTAGLMGPAEADSLGVGDALVEDAEAAAREWLAMATSRPLATYSRVKRARRGAAWARIEAGADAAREELADTLLDETVRAAILKALMAR